MCGSLTLAQLADTGEPLQDTIWAAALTGADRGKLETSVWVHSAAHTQALPKAWDEAITPPAHQRSAVAR